MNKGSITLKSNITYVLSALKKRLSASIPLLFLTIANPAIAGDESPPGSVTNCLSSTVSVLDSNGNSVMVDPALLQQNSLFKGGLVAGSEPGTVEYSEHATSIMSSCYGEVPPLIAEDKIVTTDMNRSININVLLGQPKEHGPKVEQGERQLLDIMMTAKNGKAKINGSGIRYKPNKDWCGVDNFSYQVTDGIDVVEETTTVNVQCEVEVIAAPEQTLASNAKYIAKVYDVDNDGLNDVFIFTNSGTRVKDFYLKQTFNSKFILKVATTSDSIGAIHRPDSEIIVTRSDYNADGMYDFLISSIDEYIWGAKEQIIITKKGNSTQVGKLVTIDDHFRDIRDGIEAINDASMTDFMVGLYNNKINYCTTIWIPFYVWSWSQQRYVIYWVPYRTCISGRSILSSNLRNTEHFDYVKSLSAMDAKYGLNGFATIADNSWYNSVFNKAQGRLDPRQLIKTARTIKSGVQVWRAGSVAATVILIADDATIVGVLDDVALPATLSSIAVSFILIEALDYYIIQMGGIPNDDIGPQDRSLFGAGTFTIPDTCKPEDPNGLEVKAGGRLGSSRRLNSNLRKTGCWCVSPDAKAAAHHIIPKSQGGEVGKALRSCLQDKNKRNIDIDSSINGVCLPMVDDVQSAAYVHAGDEGILHADRIQELLDLCEDSNLSNDQFIDRLRDIADGYTKGEIRLP
jgi:hypothetical protein